MALVKYNNNSLSSVTSAPNFPAGAMTHIKTLTASSDSTISFVDGSSDVVLDSTYPIYVFKFINMHPATDNVNFEFNLSTDSGSNYNVTKTTTVFIAEHKENNNTSFEYRTATDLAQSTSDQHLAYQIGNDNDQCFSGNLKIFNPNSNTFVKHFISTGNNYTYNDASINLFVAGYGNTTNAVDAIRFKMSSGNIDSGQILLFGLN